MTLMTQSGFAKHIGKSRQYVSQMKINGHLVMDGDQVDAERSIARMESLKDPAKQAVAERHASERGEKPSTSADEITGKAGSAYQQARAMKEKYNALQARLAYEREIGTMLLADEARSAVADGDAIIRNRLESLPDVLAPQLAAETDEQKIRALLMDYVEGMLSDLSRSFNRMVIVNE